MKRPTREEIDELRRTAGMIVPAQKLVLLREIDALAAENAALVSTLDETVTRLREHEVENERLRAELRKKQACARRN
jgi:hypothetical protein